MSGLRFRPAALADLKAIWFHIAWDNEKAATETVERIVKRTQLLAAHPHIGRDRGDLGDDLFSFPAESYVIFYAHRDDHVDIVRILHGAQDVPALFAGAAE